MAIQTLEDMKAQNPTSNPTLLAEAYEQRGMYAKAFEIWKKEYSFDPEAMSILNQSGADKDPRKTMHAVFEHDLNKSLETAKKEYVSSENFFYLYLALGDKENAIKWLEKGYEERNRRLIDLKVDPHYDLIRSEPRFQNLVKRVGLM